MSTDYQLIDSGNRQKLEQFGNIVISRPCSVALWKPQQSQKLWQQADASFNRDDRWEQTDRLPESWTITLSGVKLKLAATDFGHLGVFPEHSNFWDTIQKKIKGAKRDISVLNLFAYSGGATIASALAGASVCHVDASKGMTAWARENAQLNQLEDAPIRWIVEDVMKFIKREVKREKQYDAIICDPPSFGRGAKGEVFKIERDIMPLFDMCLELLSPSPLFFLFSCHTPGFTPIVMQNLMTQYCQNLGGTIQSGEMKIEPAEQGFSLPSGTYGWWEA